MNKIYYITESDMGRIADLLEQMRDAIWDIGMATEVYSKNELMDIKNQLEDILLG